MGISVFEKRGNIVCGFISEVLVFCAVKVGLLKVSEKVTLRKEGILFASVQISVSSHSCNRSKESTNILNIFCYTY